MHASSTDADAARAVSDAETQATLEVLQAQIRSTYRPPGPSTGAVVTYSSSDQPQPSAQPLEMEYVRNPDGSVLLDHTGVPITIARLLATKPLKAELSTRPGPGNRKLTYISGDGVTRTLNDIFGFDGWHLQIVETHRECCEKEANKYYVVFRATVRVTHAKTGTHKEDCGAGDATDRNLGTAIANALKASITDAMKRAARHFGEKLGNSLYSGNFSVNKAPKNLKDALDQADIERAKSKFGFPKDRVAALDAAASAATHPPLTGPLGAPTSNPRGSITSLPPPPPVLCQPPGCPGLPSANALPSSTVTQTPRPHNSRIPALPTTGKVGTNGPVTATNAVTPSVSSASSSMGPATGTRHNARPVPTFQHQTSTECKPADGISAAHPLDGHTLLLPPMDALKQGGSKSQPSQRSCPPPTATEGLQTSTLFGLSQFAAGNKHQPAKENEAASILSMKRPSTATGRKSSDAITSIATKRPLVALPANAADPSHPANKKTNVNPYKNDGGTTV